MTAKTYTGGCHCAKVRYEVTTELGTVMSCNCSMCSKKNPLLTFVGPEQFKLLSGEEVLRDYLFNEKVIHHLFCGECGVSSFARGTKPDGSAAYAINVRCLDNVDVGALAVRQVDGKSF